jgi:histidine phosphotransferase ChpT
MPRGGVVRVVTGTETPGFTITATGTNVRVSEDVERALRGDVHDHDARGVQPVLTFRLAKGVNAGLTITPREGLVEIVAG